MYQKDCDAETHNGYFSTELILDVTLLEGIRSLLLDD